ncbi:MAG: acyl carrier protein, partial [Pseudomonadota bacterium]
DSIMAVELRNRIRGHYGAVLTMIDLFTGSAEEIAAMVEAALVADEDLAALVAEVENMPAEMVAAMLSDKEEVVT